VDSVLELPSRRRIYEFIGGHPGSSARSVQRGVGMGWGETTYHLDQLTTAGLLLRERGGRRDYYFQPSIGPVDRQLLLVMQSAVERALLVELSRFPGLGFGDLMSRLSLGKTTTAFHLKYLLALGLVNSEVAGAKRRYSVRRPDLVLRLYTSFRDSFEDLWVDRFASVWGGLVRT
jgi:predicted transcriptional regulator